MEFIFTAQTDDGLEVRTSLAQIHFAQGPR